MLQFLRSASAGWVAKVLIGLLVISFAVFGVGSSLLNSGGDVVASVGDTDVPLQRFSNELNREIQQFSQQLGQPLTLEQASLFGLPSQVLSRLMSEASLNNRTGAYQMGLSEDRLVTILQADPLFAREAGFDRSRLQQLLRDYQLTEDQYVELYGALAKRRQLADAIINDIEMPRIFLKAINEFGSESRTVEYIELTASSLTEVPVPTDTDLSTYFEENKSIYRAPEYRSVVLLTVTPAGLARPDEIGDDAARERYDTAIASYTSPERRSIQQIVVQDADKIAELTALSTSGKLFSEIAVALNLSATDIDLGMKAKSEIVDKPVAEVAFGLNNGQVSQIVTGTFGTYLIKIAAIVPANVQSFEDVAGEIKQQLALQKARQELQDLFDTLEDARGGGATLAELAQSYSLPFNEVDAVDSNGKDKDENDLELAGGNNLLTGIFASDVGVENNAIAHNDGYVFYDVTGVESERDRELSEVQGKINDAWIAAKTEEAMSAKADELKTRLDDGVTLATLANELTTSVAEVVGITRSNAADSDLPTGTLGELFGGKQGHAEGADRFLVQVTAVNAASPLEVNAQTDEQRARLSGNLSQNILSQFIGQVQLEQGIEINQSLLQAVLDPQNNRQHGT
jgi:peptidyl-prolyl cis-trans isomerase D